MLADEMLHPAASLIARACALGQARAGKACVVPTVIVGRRRFDMDGKAHPRPRLDNCGSAGSLCCESAHTGGQRELFRLLHQIEGEEITPVLLLHARGLIQSHGVHLPFSTTEREAKSALDMH